MLISSSHNLRLWLKMTKLTYVMLSLKQSEAAVLIFKKFKWENVLHFCSINYTDQCCDCKLNSKYKPVVVVYVNEICKVSRSDRNGKPKLRTYKLRTQCLSLTLSCHGPFSLLEMWPRSSQALTAGFGQQMCRSTTGFIQDLWPNSYACLLALPDRKTTSEPFMVFQFEFGSCCKKKKKENETDLYFIVVICWFMDCHLLYQSCTTRWC